MCRILIIDDCDCWPEIVAKHLPGYSVQIVKTAADGFTAYASLPEIVLVSTAINYGAVTIRALAGLGANIRPRKLAAILPAYSMQDIDQALDAGATDLHTKPICGRVLKERIDDADAYWRLAQDITYKFNALCDLIPEPAAVTEYETGKFMHVNLAFMGQVGLPLSEVIGSSPMDIGIATDQGRQILIDALEVGGGTVQNLDIPYSLQGESQYLNVTAQVFSENGEKRILTIARDLTTYRERNAQIRETTERTLMRDLFASSAAKRGRARALIESMLVGGATHGTT